MPLTLSPDDIRRTEHGILPSFDAIFTDVRRAPSIKRDSYGKAYDHKPEEIFLAFNWSTNKRCIDPAGKWALYCTPVLPMPEFSPCLAPPSGQPWTMRKPGAIRVNRWERYDHYLVIASNPTGLADIWLAFVPGSAPLNVP